LPLKKGHSLKTIFKNALIEMEHGKSRTQAFAIAYSEAKKSKKLNTKRRKK
jgi:hypothetical protein